MADVGISGYHRGRRPKMGRCKRSIQEDLRCLATELLPDVSGSGSGHGSGGPHGLHPSHDSLPEQHKRTAGSPERNRVGDGGASPGRARDQCGRPAPHIVQRVVPERAPPGVGEPGEAKAFGGLSMWPSTERGDLSTRELGRSESASSL